ncbi:MAG: lipid II flippase MurJ [Terriglobales bacterium]
MATPAPRSSVQPAETPGAASPRFSRTWSVLAAAWAGRAFGAGKELALAACLGTAGAKDALVLAWTLPNLVAGVASEAMAPLCVPRTMQRPWRLRAVLAAPLGRVTLAGLTLLSVLLWLAAPGCIHLLARGLAPSTQTLAVELARILAVNVVLLVAMTGLGALCQVHGRLAAVPLASSVAAIGVLFALWSHGGSAAAQARAAALGITLGNAAATLLLAWVVLRAERRPRSANPVVAGVPAAGRRLRHAAAMLLLGTLILHAVPLADRRAGAALGSGAIAAYDYAGRLLQFFFNLGVAPFTWVRFSRWSRLMAEGAAPRLLARQAETDLQVLISALAPVAVFLALFALPVATLVYARGRLGADGVVAVAHALRILALGLGLDALLYYLLFVFHARQEQMPRLLTACVVGFSNATLDFVWASRWGVAGLAAAHDVAFLLGASLLLGLLHRRLALDLVRLGWTSLTAAGLAALGGLMASQVVHARGAAALPAALACVLVLYGGALRLLQPRTFALWAAVLREAA